MRGKLSSVSVELTHKFRRLAGGGGGAEKTSRRKTVHHRRLLRTDEDGDDNGVRGEASPDHGEEPRAGIYIYVS